MAPHYQTLQTIYEIVKSDPHPTTYLCSTRDIILRQVAGWSFIEKHLELLEQEKLIVIKKLDRVAICITSAGIDTIQALTHRPHTSQTFLTGNTSFGPLA
jgi:hypothetical protein